MNLVRRALKLAQAGDLYGAAETANVDVAHAAVVSEGLRRGMRYSIGAEVDNDPRSRPDAQNIVDAMRPDAIIRSVHFINDHASGARRELAVAVRQSGVPRSVRRRRHRADAGSCTSTRWSTRSNGCPDTSSGTSSSPRCSAIGPTTRSSSEYEDRVLAAAEARGMAVEFNTRFFYRDHSDEEKDRYLDANKRFLRKAKERGVQIAIGSDAHSPKDQGGAFEVVLHVLDQLDINEIVFPMRRTLRRVALRVVREPEPEPAPEPAPQPEPPAARTTCRPARPRMSPRRRCARRARPRKPPARPRPRPSGRPSVRKRRSQRPRHRPAPTPTPLSLGASRGGRAPEVAAPETAADHEPVEPRPQDAAEDDASSAARSASTADEPSPAEEPQASAGAAKPARVRKSRAKPKPVEADIVAQPAPEPAAAEPAVSEPTVSESAVPEPAVPESVVPEVVAPEPPTPEPAPEPEPIATAAAKQPAAKPAAANAAAAKPARSKPTPSKPAPSKPAPSRRKPLRPSPLRPNQLHPRPSRRRPLRPGRLRQRPPRLRQLRLSPLLRRARRPDPPPRPRSSRPSAAKKAAPAKAGAKKHAPVKAAAKKATPARAAAKKATPAEEGRAREKGHAEEGGAGPWSRQEGRTEEGGCEESTAGAHRAGPQERSRKRLRKRRRRSVARRDPGLRNLVIGALACALSVSACTKVGDQSLGTATSTSTSSAGTIPGELRVAIQRAPNTLNPILSANTTEGFINRLSFDTLVSVDGTTKKLVPILATEVPDAGQRRHQQGRPDDHVPPAQRREVARRRAVLEQGRQVLVASDDEQREQRERARRIRGRQVRRHARRHDGRLPPQKEVRAVREHGVRGERQPGLHHPRASAREISEPQPSAVQPAADRHRTVQARLVGARRPPRARRERRLLPRQAEAAAHPHPRDPRREHLAQRFARARHRLDLRGVAAALQAAQDDDRTSRSCSTTSRRPWACR